MKKSVPEKDIDGEKAENNSMSIPDIKRTFSLLFDNDKERREVIVMCPPKTIEDIDGTKRQSSKKFVGLFGRNDVDALVKALRPHQDKWMTVYIGLNPTTVTLVNWQEEAVPHATLAPTRNRSKDSDIVGFRRFLIDIDRRNKNGNATPEELQGAKAIAETINKDLVVAGFPPLALACSGNGAHLVGCYDFPCDQQHILANFLCYLGEKYSNDDFEIDTCVHNPCRITKLYGTITRKHAATKDRPQRMSRLSDKIKALEAVSLDTMSALAAKATKQATQKTYCGQETIPGLEYDSEENIAAATEYLKTVEPSIEGGANGRNKDKDGDTYTRNVACTVADYGISRDKCLELMEEYFNQRCAPPWKVYGSGETLEAKVNSAYRGDRQSLIGCKSPKYLREQKMKGLDELKDEGEETELSATEKLNFSALWRKLDEKFKGKPAPKVNYILENFLTGDPDILLWVGGGGMGKTTLATQFLRSVMNEINFPLDGENAPGRKTTNSIGTRQIIGCYIGTEEIEDQHHRRYEHQSKGLCKLDMREPHLLNLYGTDYQIFQRDKNHRITSGRDWNAFIADAQKAKFNLFVFDNLSDLYPGDENNRTEVSDFCRLLYRICVLLHAKVVILSHTNKAHNYSGSSGWENKVRTRIQTTASGTKENRRYKTEVHKSNGAVLGEVLFSRFNPENWCHHAITEEEYNTLVEADKADGNNEEAIREACDIILEHLRKENGAVTAGKLWALEKDDGEKIGKKVACQAIEALLFEDLIIQVMTPNSCRKKVNGYQIKGT